MRIDHSTFSTCVLKCRRSASAGQGNRLHKLAAFSADRFLRVAKKYDVSERWPCTTTWIENREASLAHRRRLRRRYARTHAWRTRRTYTPGSRLASRSLPPLPGVCMLIFTGRYPSKPRGAAPRFPPPDRIFARKEEKKKSNVRSRSPSGTSLRHLAGRNKRRRWEEKFRRPRRIWDDNQDRAN